MSKESTEPTKGQNVEPERTQQTKAIKARVMGVNQFLEANTQKEGIDGLVRSLYAKKTMSEEEWAKTVSDLLARKVK